MTNQFSFSKEPAVWIGLLISILVAVQAELTTGNVQPEALIGIAVGVLIRFFVTPVAKEK